MKRILLSLVTIGIVSAGVFGATKAFFSDTEKSVGNTFSAGTIDIAVNDQNPWTGSWNIADMKPCETGYITFNIQNPGDNPVNVWKTIKNITTDEGVMTEPECVAEGGTWVDYGDDCTDETPKSNLQDWMNYDLSVKVPIGDNPDDWYQTIYKDSDNKRVGAINGQSIFLGMIPTGASMEVTQSYHLISDTGNWAQADRMTFDIEIYAEQLKGVLVLENKSGAPDWKIIDDTTKGTLTYNLTSPTFDYDFTATGLTEGTYQLIYYPDPWTSPKLVKLIGDPMPTSGGTINVTGKSVNLGIDLPDWSVWQDQNHPEGAKIWLVPTSSLSSNILSWTNTDKFLFETALMTYDDTDL